MKTSVKFSFGYLLFVVLCMACLTVLKLLNIIVCHWTIVLLPLLLIVIPVIFAIILFFIYVFCIH